MGPLHCEDGYHRFNMDNFGRRRDRGGHGYGGGTGGAMGMAGALGAGAALGRGGCTSLLYLKLSMAVVVVVLVDEAAESFQHWQPAAFPAAAAFALRARS